MCRIFLFTGGAGEGWRVLKMMRRLRRAGISNDKRTKYFLGAVSSCWSSIVFQNSKSSLTRLSWMWKFLSVCYFGAVVMSYWVSALHRPTLLNHNAKGTKFRRQDLWFRLRMPLPCIILNASQMLRLNERPFCVLYPGYIVCRGAMSKLSCLIIPSVATSHTQSKL